MLEIYFIRHGQTEWNTQGMMQGRNNSPLTTEGKEQAKKLSKYLENEVFTALLSSPLGRAMETAEIIKGNRDQSIDTIDEFQEIAMGKVEGIPRSEFEITYPEEFFNFWNDASKYNPSIFEGESYADVLLRAKEGLKKLISIYPEGKIIVVTHGVMLKAICNVVLNHGIEEFTNQEVPENTSVTIVKYDNENFSIEKFSMTDHLN
ncbi:MAG: histidine phosphatase family protein [Cetobacterium sp.]